MYCKVVRTRQERTTKVCHPVKCRICGKTTWAGCGRHVDQVMRGVPESQRCAGHGLEAGDKPSLLSRLLGRR